MGRRSGRSVGRFLDEMPKRSTDLKKKQSSAKRGVLKVGTGVRSAPRVQDGDLDESLMLSVESTVWTRSKSSESLIDEEKVFRNRVRATKKSRGPRFRLIDLFAGAGGLTAGFSEMFGHSFQSVWANDFNAYAARSYNANFGEHCVVGDIVEILNDPKTVIPEADVVIGGPPCQGFSLLNKNREGDPRRQLWRSFLNVVERSRARVFVMENVIQLLGSPEHAEILEEARRLGFKTVSGKLHAADYGVSQRRYRAFIIGCRFADPSSVFPPKKSNYDAAKMPQLFRADQLPGYLAEAKPWRTVRDVIGDLDAPIGVEIRETDPPYDLHFGRTPTPTSLARYKAIHKEGMNRFDLQRIRPDLTPKCWIRKKTGGTDLFGRLWWDRPAFTIRTEFFKPEKGRYLHPVEHRPITHREAARIQSFPDEFKFLGSKIEIAKQIGNAVPPKLAARVADCVYALLLSQERSEGDREVTRATSQRTASVGG